MGIIPKLTFYRERYGVVQLHANVIRQARLRTKVQITIVAKKNIYSSKKNQFHDDKICYREAMNMIVLKGKRNRTQKATFSYSLSQMRIALKRYKRS